LCGRIGAPILRRSGAGVPNASCRIPSVLDSVWKPVLSALVQPPASLLLLIVLGLALRRRHPRLGLGLGVASVAGIWLICCSGTAVWLQDSVLRPPAALSPQQVRLLMRTPGQPPTAIVVLGAGRHLLEPEYGTSHLTQQAMVRLHYGVWLARRTGQPLAYAGGVGWGQRGEVTEAATAARIVEDDYGMALRWSDARSRDTRENADLMVPQLAASGVRRIVLVTHAVHMPRAVRAFRDAAGARIAIVPAPVGFVTRDDTSWLEWMPTQHGYQQTHNALHELLGLIAGA
jgi:uncharacterized SAM-binding protein YcdF (DUF218 family)